MRRRDLLHLGFGTCAGLLTADRAGAAEGSREDRPGLRSLDHLDVSCVSFSPDGSMLASASSVDRGAAIWDVRTRSLNARLPEAGRANAAYFTRDGRSLITVAEDLEKVQVWDAYRARLQRELEAPGSVTPSHAALGGETLAIIGITQHFSFQRAAESERDFVWRVDVRTGALTGGLAMEGVRQVTAVTLSPDGKRLAGGGWKPGGIQVWELPSSRAFRTDPSLDDEGVYALAFSRDGRTLASGGESTAVRLWDIESGKCAATLTAHPGRIFALAFSPDGKRLASGCDGRTLRLWDLRTRRVERELTLDGCVRSLAFSPDGRTLAIGHVSRRSGLRLLDL